MYCLGCTVQSTSITLLDLARAERGQANYMVELHSIFSQRASSYMTGAEADCRND